MDSKEKRRKIFGTLWFLLFLILFLYISGGTDSVDSSLENLNERFLSFFQRGPTTITTTQLVEEESSVIEVVEKVSPSVVSIIVRSVEFDPFSGPVLAESGIGTGFIVSSNGFIVTNSHVVNNPDGEYSVVLKDGTTYTVDEIHLDEISDLAILEITARTLPEIEFGDSDSLKVGQRAIAIGNALGKFQNTVTVGIVSGISRELTASSGFGESAKTYEGAIQTDAALNPGNSGGPLLNSQGQVIGINVATTAGADNISFAIPINILKPILTGFIKEGRIIRPYMGITYTMISKEIASIRDLPQGAFVSGVLRDTPAEEAGLQRGDIIVEFDGKPLSDSGSLSQTIAKKKVGDRIKLKVDRDGGILEMVVVLEEAP